MKMNMPLVYNGRSSAIKALRFTFHSNKPESLACAMAHYDKKHQTVVLSNPYELDYGMLGACGVKPMALNPSASYAADWFRRFVLRPILDQYKWPRGTPRHLKLKAEDLRVRCDVVDNTYKVCITRRKMPTKVYYQIKDHFDNEADLDSLMGSIAEWRPRHQEREGHYARPFSLNKVEQELWLYQYIEREGLPEPLQSDWLWSPSELTRTHREALSGSNLTYYRKMLQQEAIDNYKVDKSLPSIDRARLVYHNRELIRWFIDRSCWDDIMLDIYASDMSTYVGPSHD